MGSKSRALHVPKILRLWCLRVENDIVFCIVLYHCMATAMKHHFAAPHKL